MLAYIEKKGSECFIPPQMRQQPQEAIIEANEYNLEKVLELYINQPELLHEKRLAALEYVYKWHEPIYAGRITKNAYENALET